MLYGDHSMKDHQQIEQYQHLHGQFLIIKDYSRPIQLEVMEILNLEKKDKASLLLSDFAIDETNWL